MIFWVVFLRRASEMTDKILCLLKITEMKIEDRRQIEIVRTKNRPVTGPSNMATSQPRSRSRSCAFFVPKIWRRLFVGSHLSGQWSVRGLFVQSVRVRRSVQITAGFQVTECSELRSTLISRRTINRQLMFTDGRFVCQRPMICRQNTGCAPAQA